MTSLMTSPRVRARARTRAHLSFTLSSLLLFFSLCFSHFIRSCFSFFSPFDPSLCFSSLVIYPGHRCGATSPPLPAFSPFSTFSFSYPVAPIDRTLATLSLTGAGVRIVGGTDRLSLSLSIRDDDDDRWGRPTSGSILTACVYALVYRVLLLYTHPSRRPSRPLVRFGTMLKFCRKNRPSAGRDSFARSRTRTLDLLRHNRRLIMERDACGNSRLRERIHL